MNANFLNIVKRITAEQGEAILGDPQRLKSFIKDYAKDEPKEDRIAFGRCIEAGFYPRIKAAKTQDERRRVKADLVRQLQNAAGLSAAQCSGALDVLDAAVPLPAPSSAPQRAQSAENTAASATKHGAIPHISKRTLIFAIAAGAGAFIGALLSVPLRAGITRDFFGRILSIGLWAGLIGLGISVALITAQTFYLKKKVAVQSLIASALRGIAIGAASGALAQFIYNYTQHISPTVQVISRVICWGLLGWGLGWGVSFYVPNYPAKRAMLAGFLGGIIGGVICVTLEKTVLGALSVIMLGFIIGLAISFIEEALREAWLTVVWGPKETTTISLGQKPVVFGSSREADVYLSARRGQPEIPTVRAVVSIEGGRVILDDRAAGTRRELRNGETADFGRVKIVANIKKEN